MIVKALKNWLNDDENNKMLSIPTVRALVNIISGDKMDFVIFSNAGGQEFHIWTGDVKNLIQYENIRPHLGFYRIKMKETIVKENVGRFWILEKYLK